MHETKPTNEIIHSTFRNFKTIPKSTDKKKTFWTKISFLSPFAEENRWSYSFNNLFIKKKKSYIYTMCIYEFFNPIGQFKAYTVFLYVAWCSSWPKSLSFPFIFKSSVTWKEALSRGKKGKWPHQKNKKKSFFQHFIWSDWQIQSFLSK